MKSILLNVAAALAVFVLGGFANQFYTNYRVNSAFSIMASHGCTELGQPAVGHPLTGRIINAYQCGDTIYAAIK